LLKKKERKKNIPHVSYSLSILSYFIYAERNRLQMIWVFLTTDLLFFVIYFQPMIALATNCWKIDWDDLEKNQQLFKALCYKLMEKVAY
jgi:hypothetical protein